MAKEQMVSIGKFANPSVSLNEIRKVWGKRLEEKPFGIGNNMVECFVPDKDYNKPIRSRKYKEVKVVLA